MKKDNYIVILAWMNDLGLSLVEKTVFAIIYGFSQDGDSEFSGSRQYLAGWCGCSSLRTIDAALRTLTDRKLIEKRTKIVNGVKFCSYVANCTGSAKIAQGVAQNCPGGSAKIAHNNIEDNIDNNIDAATRTREVADAPQPDKNKRFSYRDALIGAGVTPDNTDRLLANRRAKNLKNTEAAFNRLLGSLEQVCNARGVTYNEAIEYAGKHGWGAIEPGWNLEGLTAKTKRSGKLISLDEYIRRESQR